MIWQVQSRSFFCSRRPSFQKRLSGLSHKAHNGNAFGQIDPEMECLECTQHHSKFMQGRQARGRTINESPKVAVVCIDYDVGDDPLQIETGHQVVEYQVHTQGPEQRGIFGPLLYTPACGDSSN